jgi:hypothetical protein
MRSLTNAGDGDTLADAFGDFQGGTRARCGNPVGS